MAACAIGPWALLHGCCVGFACLTLCWLVHVHGPSLFGVSGWGAHRSAAMLAHWLLGVQCATWGAAFARLYGGCGAGVLSSDGYGAQDRCTPPCAVFSIQTHGSDFSNVY